MSIDWSPNPYAIAQRLVGRNALDQDLKLNGSAADEFLEKSFQLIPRGQTMADAFGLFQKLSAGINKPLLMVEAMDLGPVKELGYSHEQLQRVLPVLLSISDAKFGRSLAAEPPSDLTMTVASLEQSEDLLADQVTYLDPVQGDVADCYLISSLISLAWTRPRLLHSRLDLAGFDTQGKRSFFWQFHGHEGANRGRVTVSGHVPVRRNGLPIYARSATPVEYWPALIEKAYVVQRCSIVDEPQPAHYQSIRTGSTPQDACQALVGGTAEGEVLDRPQDLAMFSRDHELGLVDNDGVTTRPVMVWTKKNIGTENEDVWKITGLWPSHAYAVLGVMGSGHVVLRNPHGFATLPRAGYSKEQKWTPPGREPVQLNQAGVFAVSEELFEKNFGDLGWLNIESAVA